jgi:hypothetical protein
MFVVCVGTTLTRGGPTIKLFAPFPSVRREQSPHETWRIASSGLPTSTMVHSSDFGAETALWRQMVQTHFLLQSARRR